MKKILSVGLLTLAALAVSEREASAWCNMKFCIGLNWQLQSGNNNFFWGLWKNGQVPGPEAFGGVAYPGGPIPFGQNPPAGAFPYFGSAPQGVPTETAPPQQHANYGQQNPYQSVSYQHSNPYAPNYYQPSYYQGYGYQAPYYWYQGR